MIAGCDNREHSFGQVAVLDVGRDARAGFVAEWFGRRGRLITGACRASVLVVRPASASWAAKDELQLCSRDQLGS